MKFGWKYLIVVLFVVLTACFSDQIENVYADYHDAASEKLFEKDWIPNELVFESMTDIYQRTNLDVNTCIFSFELSQDDLKILKKKVSPAKNELKNVYGISTPSWWLKGWEGENQYVLNTNEGTVQIAIDLKKNKIFGWRE